MRQMAVWIDHDEAKLFHVRRRPSTRRAVHSPNHHVHRHPKAEETRTHNHPDDEHHFFREVASALAGAEKILLLGPSVTKLHFLRYVQKHAPTLEPHIVGIETADHPTDRQLVAHIRQYFHESPARLGTPG